MLNRVAMPPTEIHLEFTPAQRVDIIDVTQRIVDRHGDPLSRYRKALYCSYHTTGGYFDQSLCARLDHERDGLRTFILAFQKLFPAGADYRHDALHLREELSEIDRQREPRNGDSHLTFIGSGLRNCVTYSNRPPTPVYFVELDGIHEGQTRQRHTTVIGFDHEEIAHTLQLDVPVSGHPVDSINLKDSRLGMFEELQRTLERLELTKGRIDITLCSRERHAALTVNEYETLLMKHDLIEVLRNPLQFAARTGRRMIEDPRAIPSKMWSYAKYDLVQVLNETLDAFGMSESIVERIVDRFLAVPTSRCLRMKRSLSLAVSDRTSPGTGRILEGTYQSPILVQWAKSHTNTRRVNVQFVRLV
jgi:thiamine phosphate synthase YjbQ (UPF0047 family)